MPKFQGFDYTIKNVQGLGFNSRYFDRSFMTEPVLDDWLLIAYDMQKDITDTIIHKAIKNLPENIYELSGIEIENKLKSRRDLLHNYAEEYYRFLSKTVDVVGTKEPELFDVKRAENGNTRVIVYALSNKKDKINEKLFSREFKYGETKEIRLYGLAGNDVFKVNGTGKKGIKLRIIGGKGKDSIVDKSTVRGLGKNTIVYDRKDKNNVIIKSRETRLQLSNNKWVNEYNRRQFKYNNTMPLVLVGYNIDDGIILGAGVLIKRYNFRDSVIHKIQGNVALQTGAFAVSYEGLFTSISQIFDLTLKANASFPLNVDNFYGLGNETKKTTNDQKYYRVRYEYVLINPMLKQTISNKFYYSFGCFYQYFKVTDTTGRFIGEIYPQYLDSSAYLPHHFTGLNAMCRLDTRNDKVLPKRGISWETEALGFYSIMGRRKNSIKIRSDLCFYLSFTKDPRAVYVFRFGGATNIGDYEFSTQIFLAVKRISGGSEATVLQVIIHFYQNTEIRFKLWNIKSYILNGQTGILLFNDIGRVWVNGENSRTWHDGYGMGIWISPFDFTVLTLTYSRSCEEKFNRFCF